MKKPKKFLILIATVLTFGISVKADNYVLRLYSQDGSVASWPVSQLQRLTFADGQVTVTLTDNSTSTYAAISTERLSFGLPDGIRSLTTDSASRKTTATIYTLQGVRIARQQVSSVNGIDLDRLPAGIYIVNMNGKKYKIARK